jgi:ABC-type cobalamin/Fe3+-siderophores transport system ATPase subunit
MYAAQPIAKNHQKTAIVGPNGCGKSTIVDALSLVLGKSRMVRNLTEHDFTGSCPTPSDRFAVPALVEWPCSPVRPRGTRRSRPVDLNEVRRKQTPERRDVMMQVRGVPSGFRLDELIVTSIRRSSRVACRPRCRPGHERHEQTVRFGISDLRTTGPIRT